MTRGCFVQLTYPQPISLDLRRRHERRHPLSVLLQLPHPNGSGDCSSSALQGSKRANLQAATEGEMCQDVFITAKPMHAKSQSWSLAPLAVLSGVGPSASAPVWTRVSSRRVRHLGCVQNVLDSLCEIHQRSLLQELARLSASPSVAAFIFLFHRSRTFAVQIGHLLSSFLGLCDGDEAVAKLKRKPRELHQQGVLSIEPSVNDLKTDAAHSAGERVPKQRPQSV